MNFILNYSIKKKKNMNNNFLLFLENFINDPD